jgi:hypothetical protein
MGATLLRVVVSVAALAFGLLNVTIHSSLSPTKTLGVQFELAAL